MTTNLRTLTREKRELPMKRNLMSITELAVMKKIAFAILCATLLMLIAAPAWADQCSAPSGGQTGAGAVGADTTGVCGALITVLSVNGGAATAFIVTTVGTAYDPPTNDDTLIGIQNSSGQPLTSIHLSSTDTTFNGIFGFEGDGPCNPTFNGTYSWCNTPAAPTGYEGPDNTFSIDPGTSCDGTCNFLSGTVNFPSAIPNGGSTWFALEGPPTSFGTISQTQTLQPGVQNVYPVANDNYKITPFNNKGGESLTITAFPILRTVFDASPSILFPGESCVPYKDFTAANGDLDTCVEFQATCTQGTASSNDCDTMLYQLTLNYDLPTTGSTAGGIGGPNLLLVHSPTVCPQPASGFTLSIFSQYGVDRVDPFTKGGSGGHSCLVATWTPGAPAITSGTFSTFSGFEFPVSNTKLNPVFLPLPVPLSWDFRDSLGNPVTKLHLCNPISSSCKAPWVNLGAIQVNCSTGVPSATEVPISSVFNTGLLNLGRGEYSFLWDTHKGFTKGTCTKAVLTFDSGLTEFPATFQFR
jgi:hypothetical protein